MKYIQQIIYYFMVLFIVAKPCQAAFVLTPQNVVIDSTINVFNNSQTQSSVLKEPKRKSKVDIWIDHFVAGLEGNHGVYSLSAALISYLLLPVFFISIPLSILAFKWGKNAIRKKESNKGLAIAGIFFAVTNLLSLIALSFYLYFSIFIFP